MRYYKQQLKNPGVYYTSVHDFDELFEKISHDWQSKARRLQARRGHKLRHPGQRR